MKTHHLPIIGYKVETLVTVDGFKFFIVMFFEF